MVLAAPGSQPTRVLIMHDKSCCVWARLSTTYPVPVLNNDRKCEFIFMCSKPDSERQEFSMIPGYDNDATVPKVFSWDCGLTKQPTPRSWMTFLMRPWKLNNRVYWMIVVVRPVFIYAFCKVILTFRNNSRSIRCYAPSIHRTWCLPHRIVRSYYNMVYGQLCR